MIKIGNDKIEINGSHIEILAEYGVITLRLLENGIDKCLIENAFQKSIKLYEEGDKV